MVTPGYPYVPKSDSKVTTAGIRVMRLSYRVLAMRSIGHLLITATLEEVSLAMSEKLGFLHIEGKASQDQLL